MALQPSGLLSRLQRQSDLEYRDRSATFGQAGDLPVVGDWDGDAKDVVGVCRPSEVRFYLDLDGNRTLKPADVPSRVFGTATDKPILGPR